MAKENVFASKIVIEKTNLEFSGILSMLEKKYQHWEDGDIFSLLN